MHLKLREEMQKKRKVRNLGLESRETKRHRLSFFEVKDKNCEKHLGGKSRIEIQRTLILLMEFSE